MAQSTGTPKSTTIEVHDGIAFVLKADKTVVPIKAAYDMQPNDVVMANPHAKYVVMENGIPVLIDKPCATCIKVDGTAHPQITNLIHQLSFEPGKVEPKTEKEAHVLKTNMSYIHAIQEAILHGEDPNKVLPPAKAGIENNGESIMHAVVVHYDYDAILAQAGFNTAYDPREFEHKEPPLPLLQADGGVSITESLTEGSLSLGTYPVTVSKTVVVEAGTLALAPDSFTFSQATLSPLLNDLDHQITSSDEKVTFTYDKATNTIEGKLANGTEVISIALDPKADGRDVTVTVKTTLYQPLDEDKSVGTSPLITEGNDTIHIHFALQGNDIAGNSLKHPIKVDVNIHDGPNPRFDVDHGTTVIDDEDKDIDGKVQLVLGSDYIHTLVFDANQPSLNGLTSNGHATHYQVDGNHLVLLDDHNNTIMTVTIDKAGHYIVDMQGTLDESHTDAKYPEGVLHLGLGVIATDFDGDSAKGTAQIIVEDGKNAQGGEMTSLNYDEPKLQGDDAHANYGKEGTSHSTSLNIAAGVDRLQPDTVKFDPKQIDALKTELQTEARSGDQKLVFTSEIKTVEVDGHTQTVDILTGHVGSASGQVAIQIEVYGTQAKDGMGVDAQVKVTQYLPLNQEIGADGKPVDTGHQNGMVTFTDGDKPSISINLPIQATDTDGDHLGLRHGDQATDNAAHVKVTIVDGEAPSFDTAKAHDAVVTDDGDKNAENQPDGSVGLDLGSDYIHTLVFSPNQEAVLKGVTSNGEPVHAELSNNGTILSVLDSHNHVVMTVSIDTEGHYTVDMKGSLDENAKDGSIVSENGQITLPFGVIATDYDGVKADGIANVKVNDGLNAKGGESTSISYNEPNLQGDDAHANYGKEGTSHSTSLNIAAGADRLQPDTVKFDPKQIDALKTELQTEVRSGDQKLVFTSEIKTVEVDGHTQTVDILTGHVGSESGQVAIQIEVYGTQAKDGMGVDAQVKVTQYLPLNQEIGADGKPVDTGHQNGMVMFTDGDKPSISINLPIQATDTDGDHLGLRHGDQATDNAAHVKVTIVDGEAPSFDTSKAHAAVVTDDGDKNAENQPDGSVGLDLGSDYIHTLVFSPNQEAALKGVTSDGQPVHSEVSQNGTTLTIFDSHNNPLMTVTIDKTGHYEAKIIGSFDEDAKSGSTAAENGQITLPFSVVATDYDGVKGNGIANVTVNDGLNAKGGEAVSVSVTEPIVNDKDAYTNPDHDANKIEIQAGADQLVPKTLEIADAHGQSLQSAVINELDHITSEGHAVHFAAQTAADGVITITGTVDGKTALTITLDPSQATTTQDNGLDKNLDLGVHIVQNLPLDQLAGGFNGQYVKIDGDRIAVTIPVQAKDSDGDFLNKPVEVHAVINDGPNGTGSDIAIKITEPQVQTDGHYSPSVVQGESAILHAGSDPLVAKDVHIALNPSQIDDLKNELSHSLTSEGRALTFTYDANTHELVGTTASGEKVMVVTFTASQDNQDVKVSAQVTLNAPLDEKQPNTYGQVSHTYVTVTNSTVVDGKGEPGKIEFHFPMQAKDSDGDSLQKPFTVTTTIVDGKSVEIGTDGKAALVYDHSTDSTNNPDAPAPIVADGQVAVTLGSDSINTFTFSDKQPELDKLISNQHGVTYHLEDNGTKIVVLDYQHQSVMTVTLDKTGHYHVEMQGTFDETGAQSGTLQEKQGEIHFGLAVVATDFDGDVAHGSAKISVVDGEVATGAGVKADMSLTEGQVNADGSYTEPQTAHGSFTVNATSDHLVATSIEISKGGDYQQHLLDALSKLTTDDGKHITFTETNDGKGHIEIIGVEAGTNNKVLTVDLNASNVMKDGINTGDVKVETSMTQYRPIDHLNNVNVSPYISMSGDKVDVHVQVQMHDTDNDPLAKPVDVHVTITDGTGPSFGKDTGVSLTDTMPDGKDVAHGEIQINLGSDVLHSLVFNPTQNSTLSNLTSNGHKLTMDVAKDGHTITWTDPTDGKVILTVNLDQNGHYTSTLTGSLDEVPHSGNVAQENGQVILPLSIIATDADGDKVNGQIHVTVNDGANAAGGEVITVNTIEPDVSKAQEYSPNAIYSDPKAEEGHVTVDAGVDRLQPGSLTLENEAAMKAELDKYVTSEGRAISFTYDQQTHTWTGTIASGEGKGEKALTITYSDVQDPKNSQDVNITTKIEQFVPLDQTSNGGHGTYVSVNGNDIQITSKVQLSDTDDDHLNKPVTIVTNFEDGADPVVVAVPDKSVYEAGIAGFPQIGQHAGSEYDPNDPGKTAALVQANGQIEMAPGSDPIKSFSIDVAKFNEDYKTLTTTNGEHIHLVENVNPQYPNVHFYYGMLVDDKGNYIGNSIPAFIISVQPDGQFTFYLGRSLDDNKHSTDPDITDKHVILDFPFTAQDYDGDHSNVGHMKITVVDDVPHAQDAVLSMEEGYSSTLEYVMTNAEEGADGASVTDIVVDGKEIALSTLTDAGSGYRSIELHGGPENHAIGTLMINSDGRTYFIANANLDNDDKDIIKNVGVIVTDGDGDTATSNIKIDIADRSATLTTHDQVGIEDKPLTISGIQIEAGDLEPGDHLGDVTFVLPKDAHGTFYVDGKALTPVEGAEGKYLLHIPTDAFTLSTHVLGNATTEDKNIYTLKPGALTFVPDANYSGYNPNIGISNKPHYGQADKIHVVVDATIYDKNDHPTLKGQTNASSMSINIEGVADKPDWEKGDVNQAYYHGNENDGHDQGIPLHIAAESADNRDGSETISYTLTINKGSDGLLGDQINGTLVLSDHAHGTLVDKGNGVYVYTPSDRDNGKGSIDGDVLFKPNEYFSGGVNITVDAQTAEKNDWAKGRHYSEKNTQVITIGVDPVANETHMHVAPLYKGTEDTPINLKNLVTLSETADQKHGDGSETKFVRIFDLPQGDPNPATITVDGKEIAVAGTQDGKPYYEVAYKDIEAGKVLIHPVPQSNVPFNIHLEGVVKDTASVPQTSGSNEHDKTITNVYTTGEQTLHIDLKGVPDKPVVFPNPDHLAHPDWTEGKVAAGEQLPTLIHTAVNENTPENPTVVKLNFGYQSGEDVHPNDPSQNAAKTDNSETLTVVISGIPEGAQLVDASGKALNMTYAGKDSNGQPMYEVKLSGENNDHKVSILSGIELVPPLYSTKDIHLTTQITVTENDGASKTFIGGLDIPVVPVIDATANNDISHGYEDQRTVIDWMPSIPKEETQGHLAAGSLGEHVVGLTLSDVPAGYQLYIGDSKTPLTFTDGKVVLSDAQLHALMDGASLEIQGPQNSNGNISIKADVTVQEKDIDHFQGETDSQSSATKVISETLPIHIQAVVEPDKPIDTQHPEQNDHLVYVDGMNGNDVTKIIDGLSSATSTIELPVNVTTDVNKPYEDHAINWVNHDTSGIPADNSASVEQIQKVVLTFTDANGDKLTQAENDTLVVHGGINNGDGSWTVPFNELSHLSISSSKAQTVYVNISASVQDLGDGRQDPSVVVSRDLDHFRLTFDQANETHKAANLHFTNTTVTGNEDTLVDLGKQLASHISVSKANIDHDQISLVIDQKDLPSDMGKFLLDHKAIHGMNFNHVTGQWVMNIPINADGQPDLSGLKDVTMSLPKDFAGTFELPMHLVNTDTVSGDTRVINMNVPVNIAPVVDTPTDKAVVVETEGLGTSSHPEWGTGKYPEPVNKDNPQVIHKGIAYEDGKIIVNVQVTPEDKGTAATGIEAVKEATLTVDAKDGHFINDKGEAVQSITVKGSDLDHVTFYPAKNFSGDVPIKVTSVLTDTAQKTDLENKGHETSTTDADHIANATVDTKSDTVVAEKTFTSTVTIHVVPVDDGVKFTPVHEVTGAETIINAPTQTSIALTGIGASLVDNDGSEKIISVKLTGVPDGFTIEGAANNGHGVWTVSVPQGAKSFNLDDVKINPPRDFSGKLDIGVTVYSNEKALPDSDIRADHEKVTINVTPVADGVSTNVTTSLSGTENKTVDMPLNIKVFDDKNSVTPSDLFPNTSGAISPDNVHENSPERVQVIISNVPEGATFTLPSGVEGSVTKLANGDWKVITKGTSLDSLQFHPGNANSENWDYGKPDHNTLHLQINALDADNQINKDLTVNKDVKIDLTPINDAPTVDVPTTPIDGDEGKNIAIHGLSVHDIDVDHAPEAAKVPVTVTLSADHGDIRVAKADGVTIQHNNSGTVTLTGTIADIDKLLASDNGVTYKGDKYYNGTDKVTLSINDNDNGALHPNKADGLSASGSVTVEIAPENNKPVNEAPKEITTEEDKLVSIAGLSISDPDVVAHDDGKPNAQSEANAAAAAKVDVSVTLSVEHGTLTLAHQAGVQIAGQGTDKVTLTGTIADIDALLHQNDGVQYVGNKYYNGTDSLTMVTNDNDNGGAGKALSATSVVPITVEAVNHAPVNTVPTQTQVTNEDQPHTVQGLQISDVDDSDNPAHKYTVTLSAEHGDVSVDAKVAKTDHVTVTEKDGQTVLNGTLSDINALLDHGVVYEGDKDFAGKDTITMTTSDNGGQGIGGVKTDTSKIAVNVRPVAETPTLSLSVPQTQNIQASMTALIPLLGLVASVADAKDHLGIQLKNLGDATLVNAQGQTVGQDLGNGQWQVDANTLKDVYIKGLTEGNHTVQVQAVSTVGAVDGIAPSTPEANSKPLDIHIDVSHLSGTEQIIGSLDSHTPDLVISNQNHSTLLGGDGNDILIGGKGEDVLIGGKGDDVLWGGTLDGYNSNGDTFVWQKADLGTSADPAHDTIMDFNVASDKVNLMDALTLNKTESMEDVAKQLSITHDANGNAQIDILQDGKVVQTIDFHGVSEHALLGVDTQVDVDKMDDAHKIGALLDHGILELGSQFGDLNDNHLSADHQGSALYGLTGDDILSAGAGDDLLIGGEGHDLFLWDQNAAQQDNIDRVVDFHIHQDALDLHEILPDSNPHANELDVLLKNVHASIDHHDNVHLTVHTNQGTDQQIILEHMDMGTLDLDSGSSSSDIVTHLFDHQVFQPQDH